MLGHLASKLSQPIITGRNTAIIKHLFTDCEVRKWDGSQNTDPSFFDGVDTVYHQAGESIFHGRWNTEKKNRIWSSRVEGSRHLVDLIAKSKNWPTPLISSSAVGYYGSRKDEMPTERSASGDDFLAMPWRQFCIGRLFCLYPALPSHSY